MHKKKILILFLLIFVICGCRANYDVKIIDNDINESFSFYEDNSIDWDSVYSLYSTQSTNGTEYIPKQYTYRTLVTNQLNSFTQAFSNEGSKYITKSLINDNSKLGILYEYNYDVSNYSNAYIPSKAFKYFNFLSNDDRRSEEHTSELQSRGHLVCRLLLEKKKDKKDISEEEYMEKE